MVRLLEGVYGCFFSKEDDAVVSLTSAIQSCIAKDEMYIRTYRYKIHNPNDLNKKLLLVINPPTK